MVDISTIPVAEATTIAKSPQPTFEDSRFNPVVEVPIYMQPIQRLTKCHKNEGSTARYLTKLLHIKPQYLQRKHCSRAFCYNRRVACQATSVISPHNCATAAPVRLLPERSVYLCMESTDGPCTVDCTAVFTEGRCLKALHI